MVNKLSNLPSIQVQNRTLAIPNIESSLNAELQVLKDIRDTVIEYARTIALNSKGDPNQHPLIQEPCTYKSEARQSRFNGEHIKIKSPRRNGIVDELDISLNPIANCGTISLSRTGGSFPNYLHFALKPSKRKGIEFSIDHKKERINLFPDYPRAKKALRADFRSEDSIRTCYRETLDCAKSFVHFCNRTDLTWDPVDQDSSSKLEKLRSQKTKLEIYREQKAQGYRYYVQHPLKRESREIVQPLQVLVQNNTNVSPEDSIIAIARADIYVPAKMMILNQRQGLALTNEPQSGCNFNLEGETIPVPTSPQSDPQ